MVSILRDKTTCALVAAIVLVGAAGHAAAQQTFVPGSGSAFWDATSPSNWNPSTPAYPNSVDAQAVFNIAGGNLNALLDTTNITVGSVTVNPPASTARVFIVGEGTSTQYSLTFQTSVGDASWNNYATGTGSVNNSSNSFVEVPVIMASNLTVEQDLHVGNNIGMQLVSTLSSAAGLTLTKTGNGNLTMDAASPNFLGSMLINAGAVNVQGNVLTGSAGVTVNSGGQFQIGAGPANMSLAAGAVLTLNGVGKPTTVNYPISPPFGGTPISANPAFPSGALNASDPSHATSFNSPVVLANDSRIFAANSLTLSQIVSGAGGLTLDGPGTLVLASANSYGSPADGTTIGLSGSTGKLEVTNTIGSATGVGPVTMNAGTTLLGTGTISGTTTFLGATLAPGDGPGTLTLGNTLINTISTLSYQLGTPGIVGSGVNSLTEVDGNLTLGGKLNVTALAGFGAGVYRLFDYTGSLTNNGVTIGSLPAGFSATIDTSIPGQVNLNVVPEPTSVALVAAGALVFAGTRALGRARRAARRV